MDSFQNFLDKKYEERRKKEVTLQDTKSSSSAINSDYTPPDTPPSTPGYKPEELESLPIDNNIKNLDKNNSFIRRNPYCYYLRC